MYAGSYSFPNYLQSKQVEIWYPGSLCWGKFSRGICLKREVGGHGAEKGGAASWGDSPLEGRWSLHRSGEGRHWAWIDDKMWEPGRLTGEKTLRGSADSSCPNWLKRTGSSIFCALTSDLYWQTLWGFWYTQGSVNRELETLWKGRAPLRGCSVQWEERLLSTSS